MSCAAGRRPAAVLLMLGTAWATTSRPALGHAATVQQTLGEAAAQQALGGAAQQAPGGAEELRRLFAEAETVFFSAEQPSSVALFDTLIEQLRSARLQGDTASTGLLGSSLSYRAQALYNLGESDRAEADLRELLLVDPAADLDRDRVSPKLAELFDTLRLELVGSVIPNIFPPEAALWISGEPVDWASGVVPLSAGTYAVSVERPGYSLYQDEIQIAGGAVVPLDVALVRTSAVITFTLEPSDTTIRIDGQPVVPMRQINVATGDEVFTLDGLSVGEHEVVFDRPDYRTRRDSLRIDALADYRLGPVALEPAVGTVILQGLPAASQVYVDDELARPARDPASGHGTLALTPGHYSIEIDGNAAGWFAAEIELEDREELALPVRLRPSIAILGVLGGDTVARDNVLAAARNALATHPFWVARTRPDRARDSLAANDFDAEWLRASDDAARARVAAAQAPIADQVRASAFVLGVLDDDLVATSVELWIWPAPPGPAAVDVIRLSLDEGDLRAAIAGLFEVDRGGTRPWLGATLVDSPVAVHPVVFGLTPGGPAEVAGVQVGDEILAIDGVAPDDAADVARILATAGDSTRFQLHRGAAQIELTVEPQTIEQVAQPGQPGTPYGLLWAAAESALNRGDAPGEAWRIRLDQAAALLHLRHWEAAVRLLRTVNAPADAVLGQPMVDYWLGLALLELGPNYEDRARDAFARAAGSDVGRLGHPDGPLIRPLAEAWLARLGG